MTAAMSPMARPSLRSAAVEAKVRRAARRRGLGDYNFLPEAQAGVKIASHFAPAVGQIAGKVLPGIFSTASGAGTGAASAGGASAGLFGSSLALPIIGAAIAAIPVAVNLFKCGTVGQVGCQKRDDATVDLQGRSAMRQLIYQVETGQTSAADAQAQMQQIAAAMQQSYRRAEDWSKRAGPDYACGSWLSQGPGCGQQYCPGLQIPANSFAATVGCGKQYASYADEINALIGYAASAAAKAPKSAGAPGLPSAVPASVPAGSPIQASPTSSAGAAAPRASSGKSLLPWALGGGAALLALFAL